MSPLRIGKIAKSCAAICLRNGFEGTKDRSSLYRPGAKVGSGSTAAAAREELANPGVLVGGRDHATVKWPAYETALTDRLEAKSKVRSGDRAAAENIFDLIDALK